MRTAHLPGRTFRAFALVLTTLVVGSSQAWAEPSRRVAVLPFGRLAVAEDFAASLVESLRAEVAKLPGITLIDVGASEKNVDFDCRRDARCVAAELHRLGVDQVVIGSVAGLGGSYSVDLKCIDTVTGRELRRISEVLSGKRGQLREEIRTASYKLLVAALEEERAGKRLEAFEDPPVVGNQASHVLKVVTPGFADFEDRVGSRFGRTALVRVAPKKSTPGDLAQASPAPVALSQPPRVEVAARVPMSRKLALGAGGAALVLAGVGTWFGISAQRDQDALDKLRMTPGGGVRLEDAGTAQARMSARRRNSTLADGLWAAGGVALVTGVVLWIAGERTTPTVVLAPGSTEVALTGSF